METVNSPKTLAEHPQEHYQRKLCPPQKCDAIYKVPMEILYKIFDLVAPPRTRDGVYALLIMTHVCRFWRIALINKPQAWATIFATQDDRRSFVETCLERSYPASLEVTVDARDLAPMYPSCTCKMDKRSRFIPNGDNPCEWHFVFELLIETRHLERVHALDILFEDLYFTYEERVQLASESCQFFNYLSPQLTLRSLSSKGSWNGQFTKLNNLTSFIFHNYSSEIDAESFRTFMLNNQFLEKLFLKRVRFKGDPNGPPIDLPKAKSFSAHYPRVPFSTIFRIPALCNLSSLLISVDRRYGYERFTFSATGDDIALTVETTRNRLTEVWQDLTGHAQPNIRHVRLDNLEDLPPANGEGAVATTLFTNTQVPHPGDRSWIYTTLLPGLTARSEGA